VAYGPLDLSWSTAATTPDADCVLRSGVGDLPVIFQFPGFNVRFDSVGAATLSFLKPTAHPPSDCDWIHIRGSCSLNGSGGMMVRWHTDGFDERIVSTRRGFNSGPLTFYVNVTRAGRDVRQLLQPVELFIHRALINHLPQFASYAVVQEPPADVRVLDGAGHVTGRTSSGDIASQ
jgi:hypothetical protein